jgi:hypothetical protein
MRIALALALAVTGVTACAGRQQASAPTPVPANAPAPPPPAPAPAPARNREADREIGRLRSQLQARDAQIVDLQRRLGEAMNEAVRVMARLRTLATRAEAASAMAEAEVTVQQVRQRAGRADLQEAGRLLRSAGVEFEAENYGGAVYLATQAKRLATSSAGSH